MCDKFASKLKEENCKAEVVNVMDGEERTMHTSEKKVFNDFLPISDKKVYFHCFKYLHPLRLLFH